MGLVSDFNRGGVFVECSQWCLSDRDGKFKENKRARAMVKKICNVRAIPANPSFSLSLRLETRFLRRLPRLVFCWLRRTRMTCQSRYAPNRAEHDSGALLPEWLPGFSETSPAYGARYLNELLNFILRAIWPSKPLIGIDYPKWRGFESEDGELSVNTTISTGMIGVAV